jgi:hypothetical protein
MTEAMDSNRDGLSFDFGEKLALACRFKFVPLVSKSKQLPVVAALLLMRLDVQKDPWSLVQPAPFSGHPFAVEPTENHPEC